jgi:hypothetical protein
VTGVFFRTGIADAGERLQSFFRLREELLESRPEVAVELLIRDFRNGENFSELSKTIRKRDSAGISRLS